LKEVAAALMPAAPVAVAPMKVATSTGKAAFTVKTKKFAEIEDIDKLFQAVKHMPAVQEAMLKAAQFDLDNNGITLPGIKVSERSVA
jgi:hypothetical protein